MSDIKQAMIFAAGFGSRLQPITNSIPKVLVPVNGKEMLGIIIEKLIDNGFTRIVINTHYFNEKIEEYISKSNFNAEIILSYEEEILETGGGLVKAKDLFEEGNILIYNGDILSDMDISALWEFHKNNNSIATLASFNRDSVRHFLWNEKDELCGWRNLDTGEEIASRETSNAKGQPFAAVHVIKKEILDLLPAKGKFSLTPEYIRLSRNHTFKRFNAENTYWFDIGSIEKLERADQYLKTL